MKRTIRLIEAIKEKVIMQEKDTIQEYKDFCADMNIDPKDKKSVNKYMNVFSRMYAQYNGISTLKVAKQKEEAKLREFLKENLKDTEESVVTRVAAEEVLNEADEDILALVQSSIVDGKLPDEIEYKGKTYKQFNVMSGDTAGGTSDVYYCNMDNTPSGNPQESDDYFFVKVALNKTDNGYEGVKEIRFVEDLTESDNNTYSDEDEAAYYRNRELYKHSNLARHRDAMDKAKDACSKKGIKLKESYFEDELDFSEIGIPETEEEFNVTVEKLDDTEGNPRYRIYGNKADLERYIKWIYGNDLDTIKQLSDTIAECSLTEEYWVNINDGKNEEVDYIIQDVTELDDIDDSSVEAPSIDGLLSLVSESLDTKYSTKWGAIKSRAISIKENLQYAIIDIITPGIIKEHAEKRIKDTAISKTIILESVPNSKSLINLKINTLGGTTCFSQKTKEPAKVLTRWLESEYLYDDMVKDFQDKLEKRQNSLKDSIESYLKSHPDLKIRINTIKAQEKTLKDAKMLDEECKKDLSRTMYGLAAEFPANINVEGNKDNEYSMKFDTIDEIVKILFGEGYVLEIDKAEKELAKKNQKVLKDGLKEAEQRKEFDSAEEMRKFIRDSGIRAFERRNENGKIVLIYNESNLKESTIDELWRYIDSKPNLKYIKDLKSNPQEVSDALEIEAKKDRELYKLLHESSLKEGYENFKIGDIEGTFNPSTGETMYSIPSKNITDKKLNLDKVPSVDTPYDTETIIKDYIEKNYGIINRPEENASEDLPVPTETDENLTEAGEEEEVVDTTVEPETGEAQAETGTASFYKVRQNEPVSLEQLISKDSSNPAQESEYIVVKEINLDQAEADDFALDLTKVHDYLSNIDAVDRKNYAFNVIKLNTPTNTILVDPVGYGYSRYLAII